MYGGRNANQYNQIGVLEMEKREINFTVRLTKTELEFLKQQAAKLCMTVGAYIRYKAIVATLEEREAK